jgi:SecY interacting protein Syd
MTGTVSSELALLTQRVIEKYQDETGHEPVSFELHNIPSPCAVKNDDEKVFWLPQPFKEGASLVKVEHAMDMTIHTDIHRFYTSQYAADISAKFEDIELSLVQVWSEDDFIRLQENLIGHLFTQRRLKLAPTLFIASLNSELEVISVCNMTGQVLSEYFGSNKHRILAPSLAEFLNQLKV